MTNLEEIIKCKTERHSATLDKPSAFVFVYEIRFRKWRAETKDMYTKWLEGYHQPAFRDEQ